VQTNMVYLSVADASVFAERCGAQGVRFNALGPGRVRLATHHQVSDEDVDRALEVLRAQARAVAAA
jgi:threonine aldolase